MSEHLIRIGCLLCYAYSLLCLQTLYKYSAHIFTILHDYILC